MCSIKQTLITQKKVELFKKYFFFTKIKLILKLNLATLKIYDCPNKVYKLLKLKLFYQTKGIIFHLA